MKAKAPGKAVHLLVTVEQLFKSLEGHLPRLAVLIRRRDFQKRISRINVDEAYFIFTAGAALYGLNAFRSAWGRLDELKALLPASIIWAVYSATFPPHILKAVENKVLHPNYVYIHTSSNRPNITYATHQVIETIEDPRNYECFLPLPENFNINEQPHVLIFVDDTKLTDKIALHLNSCLPVQYRGKDVVRHYHSKMSKELGVSPTSPRFFHCTGWALPDFSDNFGRVCGMLLINIYQPQTDPLLGN